MERYALASHQRAIAAIDGKAFDAEIAPYQNVTQDEGPRRDTTPEKMAALKPLRDGGRITAALSSQISDGAAALLIASSRAVRAHGWQPKAPIVHLSARGDDPVLMLTAPIPATACALQKAGMSLTTLVHALQRTQGRYGLVAMCEGGGQANVTILERL